MAEHHELVAEMPVLEQMGTQERQKLAKKRRNQQLKRWNQREKEWLAKEKQLNKRLAIKISEENNGLNLKQYTTYSSNHRAKKTTPTTTTTATTTSVNNNNNNAHHKNNNSNSNSNNTNGNNLKTISRFQASNGPKTVGLAPHGHVHFNVGVMLLEAAARNDYDEVKRLLMLGVSPDSVNHDGLTALHQCCIDASEPIMSLLLEFGANVDARDTEQWTPLHAACTCGHMNLVKILVKNGANLLAVNGDGNMPFDICEDESTLDYIETQMVERGITQEMIDQTRASTELQMIADLEKLIAIGVDKLNEPMENGATPLHIAAANGYISVVKFLIDHGADVNVCDNDKWTPLHGVACWGNEQHIKVVELLVEAGAHLDSKTPNDETAFDLCDNTELLERLNQLKDELASKQAASNPDLLKRTQSRSNSRIHSVRRTSVRDKNQISRREAREEAMLRVDSNTAITDNSPNQSSKDARLEDANMSNGFPQSSSDIILNGSNGSGHKDELLTVTSQTKVKQTDLDCISPESAASSDKSQLPNQNGREFRIVTSNFEIDQLPRDNVSMNHIETDQLQYKVSNSSSDKLDNNRHNQHSSVKQSAKNTTLSSSTKIVIPVAPQAQENDSHKSNDTACDPENHEVQRGPVLVPFSYTLSNLKKQRSDLRMRSTSIGGSTTTIIVSANSDGTVSLNPKPTIDDETATGVDGSRSGSPSATYRKFSGEPSQVVGEDKRESRRNCCIVM